MNNLEYKNTRTGVVIDTPCLINGGDWVKVSDLKQEEEMGIKKDEPIVNKEAKAIDEIEEEPEDNTVDFDGITLKQIKQELDAFGVEYDKRANKQTLYDLMLAQGK